MHALKVGQMNGGLLGHVLYVACRGGKCEIQLVNDEM